MMQSSDVMMLMAALAHQLCSVVRAGALTIAEDKASGQDKEQPQLRTGSCSRFPFRDTNYSASSSSFHQALLAPTCRLDLVLLRREG